MGNVKDAKVLNWIEAARLIKESGCTEALAGLQADFRSTADYIFKDGKPVLDSGAFVASVWDTPVIEIDGKMIVCALPIRTSTINKHATTMWPKVALKVLQNS